MAGEKRDKIGALCVCSVVAAAIFAIIAIDYSNRLSCERRGGLYIHHTGCKLVPAKEEH